jgi:putative membrane protein
MTFKASQFFTQPDLDRIAAAVNEAERKTSGEIVPYVVERSDDYDEAVWRGGFLCAMIPLSVFLVARLFTNQWLPSTITIILSTFVAAGVGLFLVKFIPSINLLFAGSDDIEKRVSQRAREAFLAEEVFKTRDRTGILIFLSLLEKRVVVLGDAGINAKMEESEWKEIVKLIVDGIHNGKPAEGLIDAIQQCGKLLQAHGVEVRTDDKDELSNALRMGGKQ